jgi:hypothetical protein
LINQKQELPVVALFVNRWRRNEQSSKGKGKTHKSTNRQNQSTTEKLEKPIFALFS